MAAAALGATSWMFAVEGTVLNTWMVYQAYQFGGDRSKSKARGVFKASLWHLPAMLALFVFHSRRWISDEDIQEEGVHTVSNIVSKTRMRLREACVHEVLQSENAAALCPAVVVEEGAEKVKRSAEVVQEEGSTSI